jgi:hypothetical protein
MEDAQTMKGIAALLQGFQQGYSGARQGAQNEEELKMKQRLQDAQIANMGEDNTLKRLQMEQQAPLISAQAEYMSGRNQEVPYELANPVLSELGMPSIDKPIAGSTFGTLGSMLNNKNTNLTKQDLSRVKANRPDEIAKLWVQQNKQLTDVVTNWDAKLLGIQGKLSIMTDPEDRKQLLSDLEDAKAQKKIWQEQLNRHKFDGIDQGLSPALVGTTDNTRYMNYKAKQEADKLAAQNMQGIGRVQGMPMDTTQTAQPTQAPNLVDLLARKFMGR